MLAIVSGRILPIDGPVLEHGTVLIDGSRIVAVGDRVEIPAGVEVIDASGMYVTPGLIDAHSHVGIWEEALGHEGVDVNEATNPVTPHVRAVDAINPEDEGLRLAYQRGVTTVWSAPGSANVLGGEGVTMHTHGKTMEDMILRAPWGIKAAMGENPKGSYGGRKQMPQTRMAIAAILREWFIKAEEYMKKIERAAGDPERMPSRDLGLDNLVSVLKGEQPLRVHAHRADDIMTAIRVAEEFHFTLTIEHATEAHKIADELARRGIRIIIGPTLTARSKVELRDRSLLTPRVCAEAGVEFALMTDHPVVHVGDLNIEAGIAVGMGLDETAAFKALTRTAAEICGVGDRLGTLAPGKDADIVVWNGHPLEATTSVSATIVSGKVVYRAVRGE